MGTHFEGRHGGAFRPRAGHDHDRRGELPVFLLESLEKAVAGGVAIMEVQQNTVHTLSIQNIECFLRIPGLMDFNIVSELGI